LLGDFKPKLTSNVRLRYLKEDERGKFYVAARIGKDSTTYLRIHQAGKDIIEMLDGNTTLTEIETALKRQDIEVDLGDFIKLLGEKGFLENYGGKPGKPEKENKLRVYNIPLLKRLDAPLSILSKSASPLFTKQALIASVTLNLAAALSFVVFTILNSGYAIQTFFFSGSLFLSIVLYVTVIIPMLGFLHEFAHAVTCYHFGGKPAEIGISVYLFTFFFYTDTSDALLMDKSKSIFVFLAGPLMTLFIGNVCFLLHFALPALYGGPLLMLSFGAYVTVLFGFDPMIESDGYYILQSLVDFPNLHSHAWSYATNWIKRKLRLISKEEYDESVSYYSKKESRILGIYTPMTIVVNAIFLTVTVPLAILAIGEYANLSISIFQSFPNINQLLFFIWLFESAYVVLGVAYSFWRILRIALKRVIKARISGNQNSYKKN
jgi:hypothetical protein